MAFLRAKDAEDIQFQMAPMIDCVFLLLCYFLISSTFINPETKLQTDLPRKEVAEEKPEMKQIMVMVTKDGIEVNKRPMRKAVLRDKLIALKVGGEEVYVFVDSTDDAFHQDVVEILDMANDIGAKVTVVPPYEEKE